MPEPFRLRVLENLNACLEGITPANGYTFDLQGKVFRGRDVFGENDPLPMIAILEAIEQEPAENDDSPDMSREFKGQWRLQIQGFMEDTFDDHPTDPAHRLMAEVKKRLVEERIRDRGNNILGMGGRVYGLRFSPGVVRPADEISGKAYFWLRVTLFMVENLLDPYA